MLLRERERERERKRHGVGTAWTDRGLQSSTAGAHKPCGLSSLSPLDITRHRQVVLIMVYVDPTGTVTPGGTSIIIFSGKIGGKKSVGAVHLRGFVARPSIALGEERVAAQPPTALGEEPGELYLVQERDGKGKDHTKTRIIIAMVRT